MKKIENKGKTKKGDIKREELARQVFELMRGGLSALKSCKKVGIDHSTLAAWLNDDEKLANEYARARADLLDKIAEEIMELSDAMVGRLSNTGGYDHAEIQKQKLQIDTRKWLLSKLAPKKFGDKLEISGDKENPLAVERIDATKLSTAALAEIMSAKKNETNAS